MLRNYVKTALRLLQKNRLYTGVNLLGLTLGIASCLLIGIYTRHELSFDRFHQHADRLVRVVWELNMGDADTKLAVTGTRVGPQLKRSFPEVAAYARLMKYPHVLQSATQLYEEKGFLYADAAFFQMFSFPLLSGDPATVLDAPKKLVVTRSMARKYFGTEDPLGKTIKVGGTKDFVVTGVCEDAPENSQIRFDFVGSFTSLDASQDEKWSEANYVTYLLLHNPEQLAPLATKIDAYARQVGKEEMHLEGNAFMTFHLEPLTWVHLHSALDGLEPNSDIVYIWVLGAVALLILLVACVNYTNLSTAQSAGRGKEIGIRKVMGAGRRQVFNQFVCESLILALGAVVLALALCVLVLPRFNELAGKQLAAGELFSPATLGALLGLAALVALVASAYPALILSGSRITQVLKSGFRFAGSLGVRRSLIVLQFMISAFLIVSTIIILQQLAYIRHKDLGYTKDHVLVLPIDKQIREKYEDFRSALAASPGVLAIAGAYEEPTHIGWGDNLRKGTGDGPSITIKAFPVDEHIVKTLELKIIAGADYTRADVEQLDTAGRGDNVRYSFILNESAVRALGWTPEEAIGKTVTKGREGTVKAVVKDFHFSSFHEPIGPLAIFLDPQLAGSLFVKLSGDNTATTIAALEKIWKERVSHRPFEYHFLDEDYDALYKTEQRMGNVFVAFSSLAILLACMGLFALTAYTMVQRTKEIGIRKVLGATIPDIVALVSRDFLKLICLALVIAMPLALYAMGKWLDGFAYRATIHWWVFGLAAAGTLLIALFTISVQAIKTALANPIKSLRTE
jgi:putative ABC transport system permease protein